MNNRISSRAGARALRRRPMRLFYRRPVHFPDTDRLAAYEATAAYSRVGFLEYLSVLSGPDPLSAEEGVGACLLAEMTAEKKSRELGLEDLRDDPESDFSLPVSGKVSADEVVEVLRAVGEDRAVVRLKDPTQPWPHVHAGNVVFQVLGWEISVFNDAGDFDYIDSVVAPDGRTGEFEDWTNDEGAASQPDDILNVILPEVYRGMVDAFKSAGVAAWRLATLSVEMKETLAVRKTLEDRLFALGEMTYAPCFCCGYNGPNYYQPLHHKCAERHHRFFRKPRSLGSRQA